MLKRAYYSILKTVTKKKKKKKTVSILIQTTKNLMLQKNRKQHVTGQVHIKSENDKQFHCSSA